jgi:competence protein ComEC
LAAIRHGAAAEAAAQAERWFLWAPVAFGGGAGVYFALPREPALWLALPLAAIALAAALWVRERARSRLPVIAACLVAFAVCGFGMARVRTALVDAPIVPPKTQGEVQGWVVDVAGPGTGGGRLLIAPTEIEGVEPEDVPDRVRVTVGPDNLIAPGSFISLRAILSPPPEPASPGAYDFARDFFFRRIGGVGFILADPEAADAPFEAPAGLKLQMAINGARWALSERIVGVMGAHTGGIAAAMTTGHEAWLQQPDVDVMRDAGIYHILSISGAHMAIVGGFVFLLARVLIALWPWLALRVPGKKVAAGVSLAAIGLYLVVSGAPPPAIRSAVTLAVAFLAILADRRAITLHALAVAALLVLAFQPEAVIQPGFQMSFSAAAALIALAEVWRRPAREINTPWPIRLVQGAGVWIVAGMAASFVAGAATGPFAIQNFNRTSTYGLPANLLLEPLSSFVIMPSLALGALLEGVGLDGSWLLAIADWGIRAMLAMARMVSAWPTSTVTIASAPGFTLAISFLGILWMCLWRGKLRWLGAPAAMAVLIWPRPPTPVAWIAADGGAAAVVEGHAAIFLRPDAKKFASDLWARRRGLQEPANEAALSAARFDCNRTRCAPTTALEPRIAGWWTRRKPSEAALAFICDKADIVILKAEVESLPDACRGRRVLTAADFEAGGSAEIFATPQGWRFVWANDSRGERPWSVVGEAAAPNPSSLGGAGQAEPAGG